MPLCGHVTGPGSVWGARHEARHAGSFQQIRYIRSASSTRPCSSGLSDRCCTSRRLRSSAVESIAAPTVLKAHRTALPSSKLQRSCWGGKLPLMTYTPLNCQGSFFRFWSDLKISGQVAPSAARRLLPRFARGEVEEPPLAVAVHFREISRLRWGQRDRVLSRVRSKRVVDRLCVDN